MPARPSVKIDMLAQAVSHGENITRWAKVNSVPKSTAYRWAGEASFKERVAALKAENFARLDGRLDRLALKAVRTLERLLKPGVPESTQLGAALGVIRAKLSTRTYLDMKEAMQLVEQRVTELETTVGSPGSPGERARAG